MKLKSLLKEYASSTSYTSGIKFTVLIHISNNYCKFQYIPRNSAQLDRMHSIGKQKVAKNIKNLLEKKLAMSIRADSVEDAGISFVSSVLEVENHILLMLK